eukprot:6626002-Prymnesium_polylepis.1
MTATGGSPGGLSSSSAACFSRPCAVSHHWTTRAAYRSPMSAAHDARRRRTSPCSVTSPHLSGTAAFSRQWRRDAFGGSPDVGQ